MLYYSKNEDVWIWNPIYTSYAAEYTASNYRYIDESTNRRFKSTDLTAAKPGGDTSYEWKGRKPPRGRYWAYSKENMQKFEDAGLLYYTSSGLLRLKQYLDEMPGIHLQSIWDDIPSIGAHAAERLNASKHLMRGNGTLREKRRRSKKERLMITIAPIEPVVLADLRRHYEEADTAETRTRYHMVLLAKPGQRVPQMARLVERSEDTVARVLKRFLTQGLGAVPRQSTASRRERRVTVAWESELLRVIELDPHETGQETANRTTQLLASYLAEKTGIPELRI